MLLKLRQKSSSWILRILFLLLILSFGAFGLNDLAGRVAADSAVATVGEVEISRVMLDRELGFDMRRFQ
ncbi:MAG: SurA N-terminal domain-containing protein, partial [Alphaproteobacteria bacterium]